VLDGRDLGARAEPELVQDVVDLDTGGSLSDYKLVCNLTIRPSARDEHGHLSLARCQQIDRAAVW
jgi:hypothetical protein